MSKRKEREVERSDFMEYLQTAQEKDGSLSYPEIKDVISEARLLVIAG